MEYMKLAIVTDDAHYGQALSRSIQIGNQNAEIISYGCEDFCMKWKAGGAGFRKGFDLILWDWTGLARVYGGNIVWLTERREASEGKRFKIYKYAASQEMTAGIFGIYQKLTGRQPAGPRPASVDVTAFASWQGGCGCSTLVFAAAQELVQTYGRRVLCLSLEAFEASAESREHMGGSPEVRSAGEFLYHLLGGSRPEGDLRQPFPEEYLVRDAYGVASFAPAAGNNPLTTLSREDMGRLLPALMNSGMFDSILLDLGNSSGEAAEEAFHFADRICLISSREEPRRERKFRAFLQYRVGIDPDEKIIRVRNRTGRPMEGSVCISERTAGDRRLLLEDGFGRDIHNFVRLWYHKDTAENAV